ncbi:MAG: hydroxymethylglutaryl-CoA lyase [Burkholderiaceae bacterium]
MTVSLPSKSLPSKVVLCDVAPRDGLQNESKPVSTAQKIALVQGLIQAGLPRIEVTSFVSPKAIPQLADAHDVMQGITRKPGVELVVLVPNQKGAERALACSPDELNLVMSVTASHSKANLRMTPEESFEKLQQVILQTREKVKLNVSLSCSFGCPFEGDVEASEVLHWVRRFHALGVTGVSLCDTTGMAYPSQVRALVEQTQALAPTLRITLHFHNSRGLGLANVFEGLRAGVTHFDACTGGIGGCPYAPGASGNVCMEDIVQALHCEGIETGVDLAQLIDVSKSLGQTLEHPLSGQVVYAGPRSRRYACDLAKPQGA